jgi:hypothetical protein
MDNIDLRQLMAESCGESVDVSADALLLAAALLRLSEDVRDAVKMIEGFREIASGDVDE